MTTTSLPTVFPVTCINLARAADRRKRMEQKWRPLFGDLLDFHSAHDRRDVEKGIISIPSTAAIKSSFGRTLTTGEIACSLSHLSALQKNLSSRGGAIIMEDDIDPRPNAPEIFHLIQAAREESESLDILLLCKPVHPFTIEKEFANVLIPDGRLGPWGCTMVWYGPKALEANVARISLFDAPADHWTEFCRTGRFGVLKDPVGVHIGNDTYIGNDHRGPASHRQYKP